MLIWRKIDIEELPNGQIKLNSIIGSKKRKIGTQSENVEDKLSSSGSDEDDDDDDDESDSDSEDHNEMKHIVDEGEDNKGIDKDEKPLQKDTSAATTKEVINVAKICENRKEIKPVLHISVNRSAEIQVLYLQQIFILYCKSLDT